MFFGGNLAGAKPPHHATTSRPANANGARIPSQAPEVLTPHTDALHRLTNHELRLLEELERTRTKLQAEWRVKLSELQRDEPETAQALFHSGAPTVDQLTQLFLVSKSSSRRPESATRETTELQSAMRSRTLALTSSQRSKRLLPHKKARTGSSATSKTVTVNLNRESSLPRLRTSLDVLPVLTTAAETPFEVGLDGSPVKQPHVLPIFSLPTVNVHATASALVAKEVQVIEEDHDRKQASETLGLTMDEIEMLEAELNGTAPAKHPAVAAVRVSVDNNSVKKPQQKHTRAKASRKQKKPKEIMAGDAEGDASDVLRRELASALHSVQHLTRLVKDDIFSAQKICPASELRTSLYFKRWGRDKVENIFRRLLFNMQGVAFTRWRQAIAFEKQQEKLQAYLMYKGSKKLDVFLLNWTHRKLRQAWTKWYSDMAHAKALERSALELESVRVIQRAFRGYRGRMFARLIKMQRRFAIETAAARTIQHQFRGSIARKFLRLKRLNKRREQAATRIQALARGYNSRRVIRLRQLERKKHQAAARIQARYRGRKVRRQVAAMKRQQRVAQAAVVIQRRYRGRLGRAKFIRQQIERYRARAATMIQRIARGCLARRLRKRLHQEHQQLLVIQNAAAMKIQKVHRGHRSRLGTQLKLIALREKNKVRKKAATKVQTMVRCRQARLVVQRMRASRLANMIALARLWAEYWSEDTSQWFYFNTQTSEAIWAPPPTGYTRADGMLVLQSGNVVENPEDDGAHGDPSLAFPSRKNPDENDSDDADHKHEANEMNDDRDDDDEDHLCVECEEEDALRKCDQCEDVYCDACYQKLHSSAKREKHTWKAIGTMRCIECEKMKATRWCSECQDPYCLGCFTIIHAKGNKAAHQWTDMATFRKQKKKQAQQAAMDENAQTYDEFMRSEDYQYVTELASEEVDPYATQAYADPYNGSTATSYAQSYSANSAAYSIGSVGSGADEWTTQYDENSGQYYYYNATTGESRWA